MRPQLAYVMWRKSQKQPVIFNSRIWIRALQRTIKRNRDYVMHKGLAHRAYFSTGGSIMLQYSNSLGDVYYWTGWKWETGYSPTA